ncbi:Ubiquitin carboxyl-terminal hydrolase [Dorcoceras hygrometricum]|uniref:Ubiquitin carboxyl-terminal hydrolase n=1 Tax=Dorcoceras hygrometricum TaxID=472368 RepID=A0A2Z7B951_9LAMI|nr:Ubiquitin carboxyl-terminal hydrolase [Dorcoceras hygrometricum]
MENADNVDAPAALPSNSLNIEPHLQQEEGGPLSLDQDQRVYLVPFRWWKEAQDSSSSDLKMGIPYIASPASSFGGAMKLLNNIFYSDIAFNLKKEDPSLLCSGENDEVGVSGRDYALVPGEIWLQTLKWHSDSRSSSKSNKCSSAVEEDMSDIYPLQLRLSVQRESNAFSVKISKKDNLIECFRRACKIFNLDTDPLWVWDFSGQTTMLFLNDKTKNSKESQKQTDQDLLLELQVYGLSDSVRNRGVKKEELAPNNDTSNLMNGSATNNGSRSAHNSSTIYGSSSEAGSLGLTGLQNLGNTCFMNSALQCLAHTPKLVDYFLGDYRREINPENPLGMNGEIASAFGDLLKKLWTPGATPVAPRTFKLKLAHFAPQFSGFNQHDSQELLAFLLDGLHEDLNRVKCKPYVEAKDSDGRPDEEVADEYWKNHLARNDSIIVDLCQGQYRSTLVCPVCRKMSVTFDPFMYLSLPLPSTTVRTMTLTIVNTDGNTMPSSFTVSVPKNGKLEDLIQSLSAACSLGFDETLLVAEIYNNRIIRFLEDPTDSLSLIRDGDQLIAYRLPKDAKEAPLIVFMHQKIEEKFIFGKLSTSWRAFGFPLVVRQTITTGSEIFEVYTKLLAPFLVRDEECVDNCGSTDNHTAEVEVEDNKIPRLTGPPGTTSTEETDSMHCIKFQFYLTDEKGIDRDSEITMEEPVNLKTTPLRLNVLACWSESMHNYYNVQPLGLLPEVCKSGFFTKRPQESISLFKCLEAFLKEEPLGPEDMWYCPGCKKHCQASKKLDLWRLPEILVIHLKRFSYSRYMKHKLETFVDFPIHDLDMSAYIDQKGRQSSNRYVLYAISNHYGSMGGGHYTAFVHHGGDRWYDFDDSHVSPISEGKIKTSAAYVLFYRRVEEDDQLERTVIY